MRIELIFAAALAVVVAVIHSVLGELLIFRRLRKGGVVPTAGRPVLRERHVRILWATWHLVSVFGVGLAAILAVLSRSDHPESPVIENAIAISMVVGAGIVLFATKGRHPGWLGLLGVAVLCWLA